MKPTVRIRAFSVLRSSADHDDRQMPAIYVERHLHSDPGAWSASGCRINFAGLVEGCQGD